jgi:pimeloyl-ACP methyl ester carboxylesterase
LGEDDAGRASAERLDVESADGTRLAVWVEGEGRPVVLVHGSMQDHTAQAVFVDELSRHFTAFSLDRRGCGASGDRPEYALEREFEDVAAVVEAVAKYAGEPVVLWGHSYGANCAMGGAARTPHVSHLVLYEPSLGIAYPPGSIEAVERELDAGDHEAAIVSVLRTLLGVTEDDIDALRASPAWPARLAAAPTIPRECRVEESWVYEPGQFDAVTAPTLLLSGSVSPAVMKQSTADAASALPRAGVHVLEGHDHFAHRTDPALVASVIRSFAAA